MKPGPAVWPPVMAVVAIAAAIRFFAEGAPTLDGPMLWAASAVALAIGGTGLILLWRWFRSRRQ